LPHQQIVLRLCKLALSLYGACLAAGWISLKKTLIHLNLYADPPLALSSLVTQSFPFRDVNMFGMRGG
jgi:hypothetical protein